MNKADPQQLLTVLKDRYVRDLQKKDINKFERAELLRSMIEEMSVSQREFARIYGIPVGTLQDWLMFGTAIDEDKYEELKSQGYTASAIYRQIRKRTNKNFNALDIWSTEVAQRARQYKSDKVVYHSTKSVTLLEKAVNDLNNLIVHINLYEKKKNRQVRT
jgi:predicted transcriptional regulator